MNGVQPYYPSLCKIDDSKIFCKSMWSVQDSHPVTKKGYNVVSALKYYETVKQLNPNMQIYVDFNFSLWNMDQGCQIESHNIYSFLGSLTVSVN